MFIAELHRYKKNPLATKSNGITVVKDDAIQRNV